MKEKNEININNKHILSFTKNYNLPVEKETFWFTDGLREFRINLIVTYFGSESYLICSCIGYKTSISHYSMR
jgi:hypothetical protein